MVYEPMVTLLCLFCAVILGILYLFFGAFDIVFTQNHGFKSWQVGLTFLGIMVGMIIGILSAPACVNAPSFRFTCHANVS